MAERKKKIKLRELTRIKTTHVSLVDRGANWGGQRHFFELKTDGNMISADGDGLTNDTTDVYAGIKMNAMNKAVPDASASSEDKRKAQEARSKQYGIEVLEAGANLSYPSGDPTTEALYGDPANLKYPLGRSENSRDVARIRNALSRFKGNYQTYSQESSRARVYERIVRAALAEGIEVGYDPEDPIDKLLPGDIKDRLSKAEDSQGGQGENATAGEDQSAKWQDDTGERIAKLGIDARMSALESAARAEVVKKSADKEPVEVAAEVQVEADSEISELRKSLADTSSDLAELRKSFEAAETARVGLVAERDRLAAEMAKRIEEISGLKRRVAGLSEQIGVATSIQPSAKVKTIAAPGSPWKEDYGEAR